MENTQIANIEKVLNLASIDDKQIVDNIKFNIKEGLVNPLQCMIALKRLEKIAENTKDDKEIKEIFKDSVTKALDGGKSVDMFGANLRIQATGTYYDFVPCKDSVLKELMTIQKQVDEAIKKRKEDIKQLLPPDDNKTLGIRSKKIIQEGLPSFTWTDDEFEETIYPAVKQGGSSVFITFKK